MGKRKNEESENEIRLKIKKLEAKLCKKRLRRRIFSSSSEDENEDPVVTKNMAAPPLQDSNAAVVAPPTPVTDTSCIAGPSSAVTPLTPVEGQSTTVAAEPADADLGEDILLLLGDAPKVDVELGPNIYKDVAARWQDILSRGLPKDVKDKLLKEYLIPANCDLLVPPLLNPEVKTALPDNLVKRDVVLAERQRNLGIAVAALAQATQLILNKKDYSGILKAVSDSCRILCDIHYNETKSRRGFAVSATNSSMKQTLIDTKRDKYLFGENVTEKLKSAKSIIKSGADLKPQQKNPKFNKSNFYKNKTLNTRAPQRKTGGKPDAGKTYRTMSTRSGSAARAAKSSPATTSRSRAQPARTQRHY